MATTEPLVITPFGELVTYAAAESLDTRSNLPDAQGELANGAQWRTWQTECARAEVIITPYIPVLPTGKTVLHGQAVLWRLQALTTLMAPTFSCHWRTLPTGAVGGPDAGEGLDAQTWQIEGTTLSLGTEDGEFLAARATKGRWMASRLASELCVSTIQYLEDGIRVPFASLHPVELVQVQFLIAWTGPGTPDDASTWFAVDQRPERILSQIGID